MAFFEGLKMTGGYGNGPDIINSCSVDVNKGEIVSILGPNGAGKSTAMKALLGLLNLKSGSVTIDGKDISKLSPQDRVKEGISFVPQTKNVFSGMSVEENLEMGAYLRDDDYKNIIEEIYELFPILREKRNQLVGELSGGQRQQVALGRALMIKPSVLMLDEPTAGVSPIVMDELFDHIIKVKRTNVAILMVEQNAKQALNISDRGYVLVTGENKYSGTGQELFITRAPTLRDAVNSSGGSNGPFMHSANLGSLQNAVGHYNTIPAQPGNTNLDPRLAPGGNGQKLNLTGAEMSAIVAFLQTLSGRDVYTNEKWSNPFNQ